MKNVLGVWKGRLVIEKIHIFVATGAAFVMLLASCDNGYKKTDFSSDVESVWSVSFKNHTQSQALHLSDVFDSVYWVTLQEDQCQIGNVKDLQYQHDRFYVSHDNRLSVFDESGYFLCNVGRVGHAADEYLLLGGFDVNPIDGTISLYDASSRKIKRYDRNGHWKTTIAVEDVIRDFAVLANGDYVFYTPDFMKGNRRGLWQTDSCGVFKHHWISIDDNFLYGGLYPKYLHRIDTETVGLMGGEDENKIYHITKDTVCAVWKIDVDIRIPSSMKSRPIINFSNYPGKLYTKHSYLETAGLVFLVVSDMKRPRLLFYRKHDGKLFVVKDDADLVADVPELASLRFCCKDAMMDLVENEDGSHRVVVMKTK